MDQGFQQISVPSEKKVADDTSKKKKATTAACILNAFKFSYRAVMFNQTLFLGLRWEIWSQLGEKKKKSDSLDGDFNSPECKITTAQLCPWGPF